MKKRICYLALACISMLLSACGDDAEGRIEIDDSTPAQVTNVAARGTAGAVELTWTIPSSSSFMYTKVEYIDADGNEKYQMFSKEHASEDGVMKATFKGFIDTKPVTFALYACSVRGNNQGAVEVSGMPELPNFTKVLDKITVDASLGGVNVCCANDYDETVIVAVSWKSAANASLTGSTKYSVNPKSNDSRFVRLDVDGGFLQEPSVITVNTEDAFGHASQTRTFNVTPQAIVRLDQSLMSIPGYDPNSNSGTIGYSSQESKGEGATNGRVACILDGDTKTFWHASWKEASNYPHWFIIDLGKDYTVANIELTRRIGDSRGQKGQTISTCSDANAGDKSNPESWTWTTHGTYPFDTTSDSPQTVNLSTILPVARYIKVYFGEEMKGSGNYAMLSEFNVYIVEQ
ncbi:MAG: DUF4959 domain-containing protein [Prevotella sp.]